jgi:ADP-heptose:LPS heptosyltransferase
LQELRRVSKFKYDLAIIPNHCWRSALIAKLLGIPVRVGFAKNWKNHLFLTHPRERMKMDESVCQQMLSLLQAVGIAANPGHYRLELWTPDPFRREGLVTAQNLVTIHPFAGSAKRCAPLEMWLKFALFLKGEGYGILWLGVTKELDRIREMTSDFLPHEFEDYYPGYEGIDGIAKMTKAGFAFVGHDSGPLHLSHALGVPVLGLYLPGDPLRTFPQGSAPWVQIVHDHPAKLTFEDWINGWRKLKDKIESVKSLG